MNRKAGGLFSLILFCFLGFAAFMAGAQTDMTPIQSVELPSMSDWEENIESATPPMGSSLSSAFQMLLALGCVVTLAYLVLHKGLGSVLKRQRAGNFIKVKERISLDAKHSLFLVDVGGQLVLLSASEGRVNVIVPSVDNLEKPIKEVQRHSFSAVQNTAASGV